MDHYMQELCQALIAIDTPELARDFLSNILTPGEREEIARRLQIVKLIERGLPQREIAERLNVSIATVTRGSRELKYGRPGFQEILKRIESA